MIAWQALHRPAVPPAAALARPLDTALACLLAMFGFFLPFSAAGVSIMMLLLLLLTVLAAPAAWRTAPWRDPVIAVGLVLLAYIAVRTLWTGGSSPAAWQTINRYHELLMAPFLLALFRLGSRKQAFFRGFVIGALAFAVAQWIALARDEMALLESRRISGGFALSVCAFLLLEQARGSARPWVLRAAAAFLALTVLFAIEGRTGYLVLLALAAAAAWLHSPPRWRWIAVVAVPLAVLGLGLGSTTVQKRVAETLAGSQAPDNGVMTSTAIRIELLRNGLYLAKQHFLLGTGFTSYAVVYQQAAQARRGADPAAPAGNYDPARVQNPHSEYLMQLVGGGVTSLALFLAWLALPMLRKTPNGRVDASLAGISLAFAVACLFNTLLMDFVEGHVYVTLLAWLLARNTDTPATGTREAA